MTLTNYGFLGNNFNSRSPSLEYPGGSGIEHMPNGGLWIGAQSTDANGSFTGVTTGSLDFGQGGASQSASEFLPFGTFVLRSSIPSSDFFSPDAHSEEDYVSAFIDSGAVAAGNPEPHRSLGVHVRQESYEWSVDHLGHVLFLRYFVKSRGPTLTNVWLGLLTQFKSGDKNAYSTWPPSSAGSVYGGWYSKAWVAYEDSLRLFREHYCFQPPIPGACHLERAPYWIGLTLLTPPASGQGVTLAGWNWGPGDPARDTDVERYALMSAGTIADLSQPQFQPVSGDPVELLSVGPFQSLAGSDSINVDFAIVGAPDEETLRERVRAARDMYQRGYPPDVITAIAASLIEQRATHDRVHLAWRIPRTIASAVVERAEAADGWRALAEIEADASGRIEFDDATVEPARDYRYRLTLRGADGMEHAGETAIHVPARPGLALGHVRPAANGASVEVSFTALPGSVRLELMDVRGRRLHEQTSAAPAAGAARVILTPAQALTPGIYFLRVSAAGQRVGGRFVVIR